MFLTKKISLAFILLALAIVLVSFNTVYSASSVFIFNKNLTLGSNNNDVKELQKYLNNNGFIVTKIGVGSINKETTYFGPATKKALIKFQQTNNIKPSSGNFGPVTRDFINKKNKLVNNQSPIINNTNKQSNNNSTGYTIGGSITGLGGPVTIQNNNNNLETITINPGANSEFTFPTKLNTNTNYTVTIKQNYLGQRCYMKDNTGTITNSNITTIKIACGINLYYNPFEFRPSNGGTMSAQFICGTSTVSYGGQTYSTVSIGSQCWFGENLNIGTKVTSSNSEPACHDVFGGNGYWSCQANNTAIEKYCYDNDSANCVTDGGLYEWAETLRLPYDCNNATSVDNGDGTYTLTCPTSGEQTITATQQGICPTGWHIPSFNEWESLVLVSDPGCDLNCDVGGACSCATAAGKLKATASQVPISWDGSDSYNFSALPTGGRGYDGTFHSHRADTGLWSSVPYSGNSLKSWHVILYSNDPAPGGYGNSRTYGFSVRCVKD